MSQQSSIYPYTLTDEEIDKIYNKGPIVNIDHQQRLPYFHKYFVDSILKVNKQSSIQFLLNLLYNDIGRGIYTYRFQMLMNCFNYYSIFYQTLKKFKKIHKMSIYFLKYQQNS